MKCELILENLEAIVFDIDENNSVGIYEISKSVLFDNGCVIERNTPNKVCITIKHPNESLKYKEGYIDYDSESISAYKRLKSFHDITGINIINGNEVTSYEVPYSICDDFDPNEYMNVIEKGDRCWILISADEEWHRSFVGRV